MKLKQMGNNLLIITDSGRETIVFPKGYNFDKIFSLAYKVINDENKTAEKFLNKELNLYRKKEEKIDKRIEKKLEKNKIKVFSKLDVKDLPITIPENWEGDINKKHIKNFLLWLSLNDNQHTRNNFLESFNNKYPYITNNGLIVSVRQVWKKQNKDSLSTFVQSSYVKVKGWKKSPKNFYVEYNPFDGYFLSKTQLNIGSETLDIMYGMVTPIEETTYCSNYRRGTEYEENWKIGEVVEIHDKGTHTDICGINQLHIKSDPKKYDAGGSFGDTLLVVLVNPKDVINIRDGWKYTTSRMYLACEIKPEEIDEFFTKGWDVFDFDFLEKDLKCINISDKKVMNNTTSHLSNEVFKEIINNRVELLKRE